MTVAQKKGMLDTAAGLGGMTSSLSDRILGAGSYKAFDSAVKSGIAPLKAAAANLEGLAGKASGAVAEKKEAFDKAKGALAIPEAKRKEIAENLKGVDEGIDTVAGLGISKSTKIAELEAMIPGLPAAYQEKVTNLVNGIKANDLGDTLEEAQANAQAGRMLYSDPKAAVTSGINAALEELGEPLDG